MRTFNEKLREAATSRPDRLSDLFGESYDDLSVSIKLKGHLDDQWQDWFGGLAITLQRNGDTLLTGPVVDQAALHGLLRKVRDLGMPLLSITPRDSQSNGDHHKGEIA